MIVVPFKSEHFWAIDVQPSQRYAREYAEPEAIKALEKANSFTCMVDDKPLCVFGYTPLYPTRATIWAFISKDAAPYFLHMTRIAKRMIDALPYKRIEMEVDYDFKEGHRWARMLGFTLEAERLRGFRIDGGDSSVYARIQ